MMKVRRYNILSLNLSDNSLIQCVHIFVYIRLKYMSIEGSQKCVIKKRNEARIKKKNNVYDAVPYICKIDKRCVYLSVVRYLKISLQIVVLFGL